MNLRPFYRLSGAILVAMLVVSAWGLAQVPADAQVPVHWGPTGEADGFAEPLIAFLATPLIALALVGLLVLVPRIEPRRENLERSGAAYRAVATALVAVVGIIHVAVVAAGAGAEVPVAAVIGLVIGLLFAVIGNVLGTVRSNFMFGIRTPWTLSSERSWDRTHRLVGRVFVVGGLALAVLALAGQVLVLIGAMLAFVAVVLVASFLYSYCVWRDDPDRRAVGGGS